MKSVNILSGALVAVLASLSTPAAIASPGEGAQAKQAASHALTPAQRGELTQQFVLKWGDYVQTVHGADVRAWARNMVSTFTHADPANFKRALERTTFEGAMATLDGLGHKIADDAVITALAKDTGSNAAGAAAFGEQAGAKALGDLDKDLVFTAIPSCRIVDTRVAGGAIPAGSFTFFSGRDLTSYASQGGAANDCGLAGHGLRALSINVTAVTPPATGFATVYPSLIATPTAATMIYQAGVTLSNGATVGLASNGNFRIFSERTVHYVVDVVGYYSAPEATALECQSTALASTSVAAGATANVSAANCPTGYTQTTTNCESSSWDMPFVFSNGGVCSARNNGASAATLRASRTCCRVPGR